MAAGQVSLTALEAVYETRLPQPGRLEAGPGDEGIPLKETVFFRTPDRVRINVARPERKEVFLEAGGSTLVLTGDQAVHAPWPQPALLWRLLVEPDPDVLTRLLKKAGVALDEVGTAGTDQGPAIIIGAGPGEPDRPQIWLDRETLRPVRLILPAAGAAPRYDFTLSEYQTRQMAVWPSRVRGPWGPGGPVVLRLVSLTVNPRIETSDFDLEEMRRQAAPPLPDAASDYDPEFAKIREMMEWFRKKQQ